MKLFPSQQIGELLAIQWVQDPIEKHRLRVAQVLGGSYI